MHSGGSFSCGGQPYWRTKSCARVEERLVTRRPTNTEISKQLQIPTSPSTCVRSVSGMHAQHALYMRCIYRPAASGVGLWIGGRGSRARTHAREPTGPDYPPATARPSSGVVRAGPWVYSYNQGRHGHEYDEGRARLISPHFVPVSGRTVAQIGHGGQRRRRWLCHRRKPVLEVRPPPSAALA